MFGVRCQRPADRSIALPGVGVVRSCNGCREVVRVWLATNPPLPEPRPTQSVRSRSVDVQAPRPRRERSIELSPREEAVLRAYASGKTVDAVARELDLQVSTVREYLNRARDKYEQAGREADTRVDLYKRAVEDGLVPAPHSPTASTTVAGGTTTDTVDPATWLPSSSIRAVYRYVSARLGPVAQWISAEDVTQEVLLTYVSYRTTQGEIDEGTELKLLFSIAKKKVADTQRRQVRESHDEVRVGTMPEELVARTPNGEDSELAEDLSEAMARMLDRLSSQHRDVLLLRIASGLSAAETAEVMGISAGSVRVLQHRALHRLRTLVDAANGPTTGQIPRLRPGSERMPEQ